MMLAWLVRRCMVLVDLPRPIAMFLMLTHEHALCRVFWWKRWINRDSANGRRVLLSLLLLLLGDNLPRVEFHQHGAVGLELFDRDGESKVVEQQEL